MYISLNAADEPTIRLHLKPSKSCLSAAINYLRRVERSIMLLNYRGRCLSELSVSVQNQVAWELSVGQSFEEVAQTHYKLRATNACVDKSLSSL